MTSRRYYVELGLSIALYAVLLIGSINLLKHGNVPAAWRIAVTLSPMLGAVPAAWAVWRQFQRMDEFQRKVRFDTLAFAFYGTALLSLGYGFLENVGFPRLSMFAVWPVMAALWGTGSIVSIWRYRR